MATITRRELIEQAATKVGALGAGQALEVEDLNVIDSYCTQLFDQLAEDEILTVGDDDAIPASWAPYLSSLLANLIAPDYGMPFQTDAKQAYEAILRRLVRQKETFEPLQVDYF